MGFGGHRPLPFDRYRVGGLGYPTLTAASRQIDARLRRRERLGLAEKVAWKNVGVPTARLRHALRRDLPAIVELWVEAFADDPYLRWIPPEDQRWPAFGTEWMTFIADRVFERGHTYLAGPIDVAVAWVPPDVALVGPDDVARGQAISRAREARAGEAVTTIMAA